MAKTCICQSCNSSKGAKDPEEFFTKKETIEIESVYNLLENK